jgi:type IV fimbrial biogenesis protein FimT
VNPTPDTLCRPGRAPRRAAGQGRSHRRAPSGFTLVETLAVLALLAALALAAVAFAPDAVERRRLAAVADQALSALHAARVEAQAQGRTVRVSALGDAGGSCLVVHTGPREACVCPPVGSPQCEVPARLVAAVASAPSAGIALRANAASAVYDPVLGTVTPTLTLQLTGSRGTELRHVVNLTGRVRSCVAAGAMPGWPRC